MNNHKKLILDLLQTTTAVIHGEKTPERSCSSCKSSLPYTTKAAIHISRTLNSAWGYHFWGCTTFTNNSDWFWFWPGLQLCWWGKLCSIRKWIQPEPDSSWVDSDGSLMELEGDDLEENLWELWEKEKNPEHAAAPSRYDLLTEKKSAKEWRKAKKNCSLGYTGTSVRTRQRKSKVAWVQAVERKKAKYLWAILFQSKWKITHMQAQK